MSGVESSSADAVVPRQTPGVGRTMFWMALGTLVYLGSQWLLTVLVVRISGQALNGDYTLALSSSAVAYAIVLFGMRPFQISDTRREFADSIYLASRLATMLLAAASFALMLPFTADVGRLWPVLLMFLGFRLTEGWMDVLHGILQNADRMRLAGLALIIRAVVEVVAFAGVLAATQSLTAAVGAMFAVSLVALLVLEGPWSRPYLDGTRFAAAGGWPRTMVLLRRCAPLLLANLAYAVMLFVPRNSLSAIWGAELLGYYGSISAPLLLVPIMVSYLYTPFMPALAEHHHSGRPRQLALLSGRVMGAILGLIVLAFVVLRLIGAPSLALLFGPGVLDHLYMLWPVAASVSLTALVYYGNAALTAIRRMPWVMVAAAAALVPVLTMSDLFVRHFGPNGASFILILGQAIQVIVLAVGFISAIARSRVTQPD